jgi:hypothetical protein
MPTRLQLILMGDLKADIYRPWDNRANIDSLLGGIIWIRRLFAAFQATKRILKNNYLENEERARFCYIKMREYTLLQEKYIQEHSYKRTKAFWLRSLFTVGHFAIGIKADASFLLAGTKTIPIKSIEMGT